MGGLVLGWRGCPLIGVFLVLLLDVLPCACHGLFISPLARTHAGIVARVCACASLLWLLDSQATHGDRRSERMDDKCTRKSPRVKTKEMEGSRIIRLLGDWVTWLWAAAAASARRTGQDTQREKKVKRRRRFHRPRKIPIPATWNRAALCCLCAKNTTGGRSTTRRVQFVRLLHIMLCTTSCRVRCCLCLAYIRCMQLGSRKVHVCTDGNATRMRVLGVDVRGCL